MQDGANPTTTAAANVAQDSSTLSPELQANLAMAFGEQQPVNNESVAPIDQREVTQQQDVQPAFDEVAYLGENFGWKSKDEAKAEIEELRKLKQSATSPFEGLDENSKKIAFAIKENKIDDIYDYVSTQKLIRELDTKTPEEKLKAYLKLQNPLFNPDDVEWKYNKLYSVDETQYKDSDGEVFDPQGLRIAQIELQQKLQQDIEKANEYFSTKKDIKLPDFASSDTGYEDYKKMMSDAQEESKKTVEAYKKVTPTDIKLTAKFNDEANKLGVDFDFVPDADSFNKAIALVTDTNKFYADYYGEDGSPKRNEFLQDIYFAKNKDRIIGEAMKQAVNATIKWFIARNNGNAGGQRQYNADHVVSDELKEQMDMAFAGQNGNR